MALEELARAGARQFVGELDRPGHLVAGEVLTGERGDLLAGQRRAGRPHDRRVDDLSPGVRRDAEDGHVVDLGVPLKHGLDLGRVDVHATGDDHVGLAVADVQVALVVPVGDVADGVKVTLAVRRVAGVVLVVGVEDALGPDEDLAGVVRPGPGDLVAVVADQLDLDEGAGLPQDPGLRIWSSGISTVSTPSSVDP